MADKILKGCNCCLTHKRAIRLMGARARKAWCRNCHCPTIWDALSEEELAAYNIRRAQTEALLAELMAQVDEASP